MRSILSSIRYPAEKSVRSWLAVIFLVAGMCIGWIIGRYDPAKYRRADILRVENKTGSSLRLASPFLIHRLLACNVSSDKESDELAELKRQISGFIADQVTGGNVYQVSVYLRELESGRWMGIEENHLFFTASLRKVPMLIAWLKAVELHPEILSQKLEYRRDLSTKPAVASYVSQVEFLNDGKMYTVEDLLRRMIVYSDNDAATLLYLHADPQILQNVYADLGLVDKTQSGNIGDYLSPKTYSLFLRILYNATYLNSDTSIMGLNLLRQSVYRKGLVAGVPETVPVAHKFGEWALTTFPTEQGQVMAHAFHDCGIVYMPQQPYLLCIMTTGNDFPSLENIVYEISRRVYKEESLNAIPSVNAGT